MKTANVKRRSGGNKRLWSWVLLGSLMALTVDLGLIKAAKADIRVRARVRTPHVSVDYDNGPHYHDWDKPVHCDMEYRITKRDRKIARRLARMTGYRKVRLLNMRRHGYTWRQIGWELGISHRTMRVAMYGPRKPRTRDGWYARGPLPYDEPLVCRRPAYGR